MHRPMGVQLAPRQASCIQCPANPAPCSCSSIQLCERTVQTCSQCATNFCVANPAAPQPSSGFSTAALAGAVVGCILLLVLVVGAFFLWRRRAQAKKAEELALEKSTISPFDLLGANPLSSPLPPTPGPGQDVRFYQNSVINLHDGQRSPGGSIPMPDNIHNPFNDAASTTTNGTNVIPIAFVPPSDSGLVSPTTPSRPARSPELHLRPNLPVDNEKLLSPKSPFAAKSTRSGVSNRSSIMSASSSLYDRPQIVTSAKVGRQVLGVVRAEVVQVAPNPTSPVARRAPSMRSPLAGPSYNREDVVQTPTPSLPPLPDSGKSSPAPSNRSGSDPFGDHKQSPQLSPRHQPLPPSPNPQMVGTEAAFRRSEQFLQQQQYQHQHQQGRLLTPQAADPHSPAPPRPQFFPSARESGSSFVSATSRADSIMNTGFVFFPPTPSTDASFAPDDVSIMRGVRMGGNPHQSMASTVADLHPHRSFAGQAAGGGRGMSVSSSGLEAFPFEFGAAGVGAALMSQTTMEEEDEGDLGRAGMQMRSGNGTGQRASLDTLQLSRDVAAHPLGYDLRDGRC